MSPWHHIEKEFRDVAEDVEGVNIHYVCTPKGRAPDWETQRVTRFMPVVENLAPNGGAVRLRKRVLRLPRTVRDESGSESDRYLLHHYFEIFRDGHRRYSELYTEEITSNVQESRG